MPNTINIVQPKAEDGVTEVSFVTRTNSIFKSDGTPLGDSMDEYMEEVDELSSNLAELISYSDVAIGNVTMGTGGYADIQSHLPTKPGYTLLFVQVQDYGQGKGALSVDVSGRYISGTPSQTWTNVTLRYFFIKNLANA